MNPSPRHPFRAPTLLLLATLASGCGSEEPPGPAALRGATIDLLSHPFAALTRDSTEAAPILAPAAGDTLTPAVTWEDPGYWRIPLPVSDLVQLRTLSFRYAGSAEVLRLGTLARGESDPLLTPFALEIEAEDRRRPISIALGRELMPAASLAALTLHPPHPTAGTSGRDANASDLTETRLVTAGAADQARVTLDGRTRRCLVLEPDAGGAWRVEIPPDAFLSFGYGVREPGWQGPGDGSLFQVEIVEDGAEAEVVWESYLTPKRAAPHRTWHHARVDLASYAGRTVTVRLWARASPTTGAPFSTRHDPRSDAPVFSAPRITSRATDSGFPNVIVILVDTLRLDGLGAFGGGRAQGESVSPHVDRLLAESAVFERAYATAPWTHPSTGSLLTGLLPHEHGLGTAPHGLSFFYPGVTLLSEHFKSAGYATAVVSNNLIVSPDEGFARGVDSFDTRCFENDQYFGAERVTRYAMEWLDAEGSGPFFLYLHYFDPHDRYQAPLPHTRSFVNADLQSRVSDAGVIRGRVNPMRGQLYHEGQRTDYQPADDDLRYLRGLYDGEIQYTDRSIGRLLAYLEARNLLENTLLILTSDHGEEFLEHDYLKHGQGLYEELIHVPLIVRFPKDGRGGKRIATPVSLIDVAPTLLAACNLHGAMGDPGSGRDLRDLLAPADAPNQRPVFAVSYGGQAERGHPDFGPKRAVIGPRFKLIHTLELDRFELFDLEVDPAERQNLAAQHPDEVERLRALAESALAMPEPGSAAPMNPALLEKLRALGYVH